MVRVILPPIAGGSGRRLRGLKAHPRQKNKGQYHNQQEASNPSFHHGIILLVSASHSVYRVIARRVLEM